MIVALIAAVAFCTFAIAIWNVARWPAVRSAPGDPDASVSLLIPARNEEGNLAACLESALGQRGVTEILIYDDESTDGTAAIIAQYAKRDRRVRGIEPGRLPKGWCGKSFACSQLAAGARSEWLLFLDADARLEPGAVSGMVREAKARGATLLSCWPRLTLRSVPEKILMPMLNFVVFTIYPAPLGMARNDASLGLAHGACVLCARAAYEAVGGHAVVASEIFEDTVLARRWRERGEVALCMDGADVVSVRMYGSTREIWSGFQKNFRAGFGSSASFLLFWRCMGSFLRARFLRAGCRQRW